jgi:hypothetical protein
MEVDRMSQQQRIVLSRSQRQRRQQKKRKLSLRFYHQWVLWGGVAAAFMAVVGLIWFLCSHHKASVAEPVPSTKTVPTKAVQHVQNRIKPEVHLLQSSETYPYGDLYSICHASRIELKLVAKGQTEICLRIDGPTGPILTQKKIAPHQIETFTHDQWLSLQIAQPHFVTISVNGVIIDTTHRKNECDIHFKLEQNKKEQK